MNTERIRELAEQAGIDEWWDSGNECREVLQEYLEKLAEVIAAEEREACAKMCQDIAMKLDKACDGADKDEITSLQSTAWQIRVCAAAIRARGNE